MLFIPVTVFFVLVAIGLRLNELSLRAAAVFLAIWVGCRLIVAVVGWPPESLVGCDALLGMILVLMIFGGDVGSR